MAAGPSAPTGCVIKMDGPNMMQNLYLNLVLLGRTGVGKSSAGNTILGREAFTTEKSSTSVTRDVTAEVGDVCGVPITVYDTPGLSGTESEEELWKYEEVLKKCESGMCAFLLVLQLDRFTEDDQKTVEKIEKLLGAKRIKNTWILFTGGDELEEENKTIDELINETEVLNRLTQKYEGRHLVFNSKYIVQKTTNNKLGDQVKSQMSKVLQRNTVSKRIQVNIQDIPVVSRSSRRIVLLGKTGVGKSAAGNTILGQEDKKFKSALNSISVTSESSDAHTTVSGRSVSVVDTPGFFDTQMKPEQLVTEIARSVYLSSPGPHAFLIVFPVNMRFTEQEQQIPQQIEMMFGQEVLKYSIVLFTYGDLLEEEPIEELIERNIALRDLVDQCGGRFHVFNNRNDKNRDQVNDLLENIDTMIEQNGGGHYSNQMFQDAQRFRQEEEERRQQEEQQKREETKKVSKELESLKAEKQRDEKKIKHQDKVIKEANQRIRTHIDEMEKLQIGFQPFLYNNQNKLYLSAIVAGLIGGAVVGGLASADRSGAVKRAVAIGGVVAKTVFPGRTADRTVIGVFAAAAQFKYQ